MGQVWMAMGSLLGNFYGSRSLPVFPASEPRAGTCGFPCQPFDQPGHGLRKRFKVTKRL